MKVSAIIASGKYTDTINGEQWTADRVEVVAAFTRSDKALAALDSGTVDVAEPQKWGVRSMSVYDFEVKEGD